MENRDLVSIITPCYNASDTIDRCIKSVLNQSYHNWEMIIVDDFSIDDSKNKVDRYHDTRIKSFKNSSNSGPAETRNHAISHAQGRYLMFLDADDEWHQDKVMIQLKFMKKNNYYFSFTAYNRVKGSDYHIINVLEKVNYKMLKRNTTIYTSTVCIDRKTVEVIKMKKVYYDDLLCWLELLSNYGPAHSIDKPLVNYYITEGSVSSNKIKSSIKVFQIYNKCLKDSYFDNFIDWLFYSYNGVKKYYISE